MIYLLTQATTTLDWVNMSYSVNEYKVAFQFKNRNTSSAKYFQFENEDLDVMALFKQAMRIDGYNMLDIKNTCIYKYNRFSRTWEKYAKNEQLN